MPPSLALQELSNLKSPSGLRVVDLRAELKSLGLGHAGLKNELISRLRAARFEPEAATTAANDAGEVPGGVVPEVPAGELTPTHPARTASKVFKRSVITARTPPGT
jgi:hypothetical protein